LRRSRGAKARLDHLLGNAELDESAVELIRRYEMQGHYPRLLDLAAEQGNELRVDAIRALFELEQSELIAAAIQGADEDRAGAIARVVAKSGHPTATELLIPIIANVSLDIEVCKEIARDLANTVSGARELLRRTAHDQISKDIQHAIAGRMLMHPTEEIQRQAEAHFTISPAKNAHPLPRLPDLVAMIGDPQNGQQVFAKQGKCADCHQAQGQGKAIGPDLSQIGTKLATPALYEAILYPSAAISHNFESYVVVAANGQITTGVLVNQNESQIQLRDAEGILHTFGRSGVDEFSRQNISLMPANAHQAMTVQELVDLVSYLMSLKTPQ
jgi:putative heme-binding domain-containing protein